MNLLVLHMISIVIELFTVFYVCQVVSEKQKISPVFILTAITAYIINFAAVYFEFPSYIVCIKSFIVFFMVAVIVYKIKISKMLLINFLFLICGYTAEILASVILSYALGDTYDNIPMTDTGMSIGMFLSDVILFILSTFAAHFFQ